MGLVARVAAAMLFGLVSVAAQAGQISETETISVGGCSAPVCQSALSFNQFDPSVGSLQTVTLSISGTATYFVSLSPDPLSAAACCGAEASWQFNTGYSYNAPGFPFSSPIYWGSPQFAATYWYDYATTVDPSLLSVSKAVFYTGTIGGISQYIGSGELFIDLARIEDSPNSADVCFDGGIRPVCSEAFSATVALTYNYVPEPAGLPLMGLGMVGILLTARRMLGRRPV